MTFKNWVETTGPKNIAKKLKVDPSTVSQWKIGKTCPPARVLIWFHQESKGKLTYPEMLRHFAKSKARKHNARNHAR